MSIPAFAAETASPQDGTKHDVESVIKQMKKAQSDGKITSEEQEIIFKDVPKAVVEQYNEIVDAESAEILETYYTNIPLDSDSELNDTQTFNLDCGAQLIVTTEIKKLSNREETTNSAITGILEKIGMYCYADSQAFGTTKHRETLKIYGAGYVKLTLDTTIKASSSGLQITKTHADSNSAGLLHDVSCKSKIEKASAGKGKTCKSKGGVRWYEDLVPVGHTSKKWRNLRCKFKVTSINKDKKKVYYTYSTEKWTSEYWD